MKSSTVQCCAVMAVLVLMVTGGVIRKEDNPVDDWSAFKEEANKLSKKNLTGVLVSYRTKEGGSCVKELPCLAEVALKSLQMEETDKLFRFLLQYKKHTTNYPKCTFGDYPTRNLTDLLDDIIKCPKPIIM